MSGPAPAALGRELLDDPDADPAQVGESLRHIVRANRWFGGWWAVRRGLGMVLGDGGSSDGAPGRPGGSPLPGWRTGASTGLGVEPEPGRPGGSPQRITMLDVGCGSGDLMARAVRWAATRGIRLVPIGLERHRAAAKLAGSRGIATLLGCAGALPIRDHSVDLVIASQLVHHFSAPAMIRFCQAADRLARCGVIIADLRRSPVALAGFWVGSRLLRFDPATRQDGLTSVRRGYSDAELAGLLASAGIRARIERTPGFRLVATWRAR